MANRSGPRGLMFIGAEKHIGERNKFIESELALWVEALLDDCVPPKPFDELFKDGVLLCRALNAIKPGSVGKIQKPWTKEKQMENINSFISGAKSFGVPDDRMFTAEDLWEGSDAGIAKVINCLLCIGRMCLEKGYDGPALGPKPTGNPRDWNEQQLRAGEGIVPAQHGSNKFASQKGSRFGSQRDILPGLKSDYVVVNPDKFTPEQLRASESIIPFQYGTNKLATQKGIRMGAARDILPDLKTNFKSKQEWTEQQLRASDGIIPLQYGTNKLASQKGIKMGGSRDIMLNLESDYKKPEKAAE